MKAISKILLLIVGIAAMAVMTSNLPAQGVPGAINYQGRLLDDAGQPVTSAITLTFTLWDSASNGSQLGGGWSDSDTVTPDVNGNYSTDIGDDSGNPVPAAIFDSAEVWLNINVSGEDLAPRARLLAVPYAVKAESATNASIAGHANTADAATNAEHATTADSATIATHADTADVATVATSVEQVKQIVHDFVVASGQSVTAGDVVAFLSGEVAPFNLWSDMEPGPHSPFNAADTSEICAAALSSSTFVVAYRDRGNSNRGTTIAGEVLGNEVSWGGEEVFSADLTRHFSIAALSASRFVVAYRAGDGSGSGVSYIGFVEGTSIEYHLRPDTFNSGDTSDISVTALSSNKIVVAYQDGGFSQYGLAVIGNINSGGITYDPEYIFNAGVTHTISTTALSSSQFVVTYVDSANSEYGAAIVGTIAGGSLAGWGPEGVFNDATTLYISATGLSSNRFVVSYRDNGNSDYGTAIVGEVDGNTITYGSENVFNSALTYDSSVAALSSDSFMVVYSVSGDTKVKIGDISEADISYRSGEYLISAGSTGEFTAMLLSPGKFVVTYRDHDNSDYGMARVVSSGGVPLGIAADSATGGQTVTVILDGVSDVHSGLTPGEVYAVGDQGALNSDDGAGGAQKIGRALSPTELLLEIR